MRHSPHARSRKLATPTLAAFLSLASFVVAPSTASAACACTGMTIEHTTGNTVTLCSSHDLHYAECQQHQGGPSTLCPATTYSYTCPVGVNTSTALEQWTGFGVRTTLTGTSSECHSGQALQLTITSNQHVDQPEIHATPTGDVQIGGFTARVKHSPPAAAMPAIGAMTPPPNPVQSFGADTYTDPDAPDLLIERTASAIKWWDNTNQEKDSAQEQATWSYRFASFVQGTNGQASCACVFNINVDWRNAQPATSMTRVDAQSTACTF